MHHVWMLLPLRCPKRKPVVRLFNFIRFFFVCNLNGRALGSGHVEQPYVTQTSDC